MVGSLVGSWELLGVGAKCLDAETSLAPMPPLCVVAICVCKFLDYYSQRKSGEGANAPNGVTGL